MRSSWIGRTLTLAVILATVVACTGDPPDLSTDGSADAADAADDAGDDDAADGGEPGDGEPSGRLVLSGWEEHHPSIVSLALTAVEVDPAGNVFVELESVNSGFRGESRVSLALRDVLIRDDRDNVYGFVRPEGEEAELRFAKDHRLVARLAFEGPIDPDARRVTVGFNQRLDEGLIHAAEHRPNQYPRFLFVDVPLPGVGLESEADRGASGDLTERAEVELDVTASPDDTPDLTVTVERIIADANTVTMELEIVNPTSRQVSLAGFQPRLDDGHGSQFVYVRSDSDDRTQRFVELDAGSEATVVLSWRGSISPAAQSLTFEFNRANRNLNSPTAPYLLIDDLPIPGR